MLSLVLLFVKKRLFIVFQTNILDSLCFLPFLLVLLIQKGNFLLSPPEKQPHLGTCSCLLLLLLVVVVGGGGGVVSSSYYPCCYGPCCFVFWPHSSIFSCLCLFFGGGGVVFSSFLWLQVWVSSFLLTSLGNFLFWLLLLLLLLLWVLLALLFFHCCYCHYYYFVYFLLLILWLIRDVAVFCCSFLLWHFSSCFAFFLSYLLLYLWSFSCVFLVLVLPLAFALVFAFLAFTYFFSCLSLLLVYLFPFITWGGRNFGFHFLIFRNATFARSARFVSGPFLGMGPVFFRKHYKNRGFSVFWHPKKDEMLGPKSRVKMLAMFFFWRGRWPAFNSTFAWFCRENKILKNRA